MGARKSLKEISRMEYTWAEKDLENWDPERLPQITAGALQRIADTLEQMLVVARRIDEKLSVGHVSRLATMLDYEYRKRAAARARRKTGRKGKASVKRAKRSAD